MPIRPIPPQNPPTSEFDAGSQSGSTTSAPAPRKRVRPDGEGLPRAGSTPEQSLHPYEVGYGKPPKPTQFKPGRSGNPKGRPKAAKGLKTITRELLTPKVTVRTAAGETKMSRIDALLHKLMEQAMKGNPRAIGSLISLYASAVPDLPAAERPQEHEALTATDEAILAEFRAMILAGQGEGQ